MIVEYDGSYYHAGKVRADREQTAALESAGWTVFRVREQPLPQLGGYEISVSPTQSIKSVAIEVIRGLAPIDYEASRMSEYIAAPTRGRQPSFKNLKSALGNERGTLVVLRRMLASEIDRGLADGSLKGAALSALVKQFREIGDDIRVLDLAAFEAQALAAGSDDGGDGDGDDYAWDPSKI